jgi:hypothetical protein
MTMSTFFIFYLLLLRMCYSLSSNLLILLYPIVGLIAVYSVYRCRATDQ